ncbi:hypothetical protein THAOC_06335 [Thalassiosira oceanica]|uniref:Uncharacterized protein n=1 Tax=Thalassiosira oceanica TaxID=159749 RepID=K0TF64_THAOC|nr:hypothetical protein THAOC_06335 [Thalassiosira oceanica]|eukprot:EJK72161.1 hypothetical protein THAOC_06335 [Thalassiosira oceanica]
MMPSSLVGLPRGGRGRTGRWAGRRGGDTGGDDAERHVGTSWRRRQSVSSSSDDGDDGKDGPSSGRTMRQHSRIAFHDSCVLDADGLNDASDSESDGWMVTWPPGIPLNSESESESESESGSVLDSESELADLEQAIDGDDVEAVAREGDEDDAAALRALVARQAARIDELASDLARERARSSRLEVRNTELDADVSILAKKLTVQQKREMNLMNAIRRMQSEHACPATPPTPRRMSSSDRWPLARKLSLPGLSHAANKDR